MYTFCDDNRDLCTLAIFLKGKFMEKNTQDTRRDFPTTLTAVETKAYSWVGCGGDDVERRIAIRRWGREQGHEITNNTLELLVLLVASCSC